MRVDREPAVRGGNKDAPGDPAELLDEAPLLAPPARDVLDHGVREAELERAVGEGERAPVRLHDGHPRKRRGEAVEPGVADGGDLPRPGVARLEEVVAELAARHRLRRARR